MPVVTHAAVLVDDLSMSIVIICCGALVVRISISEPLKLCRTPYALTHILRRTAGWPDPDPALRQPHLVPGQQLFTAYLHGSPE